MGNGLGTLVWSEVCWRWQSTTVDGSLRLSIFTVRSSSVLYDSTDLFH
jgi:hypothetical protein